MVFASASVFLLPLATAIAGALWIRSGPSGQLTGALAGFAVGVMIAALLLRVFRPRTKALS